MAKDERQNHAAQHCRQALAFTCTHLSKPIHTGGYSVTPGTPQPESWCTSKTFCGFPGLKAIIGILWLPNSFTVGNTAVMHPAKHALPRQIGTATAAGKQYTIHFDSGHEVKCTADSTDAFAAFGNMGRGINDPYVDGLSITYGSSPRHHL